MGETPMPRKQTYIDLSGLFFEIAGHPLQNLM